MKKRIKYWIEGQLTLALARILPLFSLRTTRRLGKLLGTLIYLFFPERKGTALYNLSLIRPEDPEIAYHEWIRLAYQNMAMTFLELFHLPAEVAPLETQVRWEGENHFHDLLRRGQGVVVVSAHFGNWEYIGAVLARLGARMNYLVRVQNNPVTGQIFDDLRHRAGIGIIPKTTAMRQVFYKLKAGEWVGFLCDQDGRESGMETLFFGQPVSWVKGPAHIARKLGVPILPVFCHRDHHGNPVVRLLKPWLPEDFQPMDLPGLNRAIAKLIEKVIRHRPHLWFMFHNRFGGK